MNQGLATEAPPSSLLRPVLVAAGCAALLTAVAWFALRDRWDGAMLAGIIVALVILPFPLFRLWQGFGGQLGLIVVALAITALVATPVLVAVRARVQGRPIPRPSAGRLNEFAIVLLLVVFATNSLDDVGTAAARITAAPPVVDQPEPPSAPPDIVIILLDGYPRADVLERQLGIDNSGFISALSDRGFDVALDSNSNYVFTGLTLASMFQMRYMGEGELSPEIGSSGRGHDLLRHATTSGLAWTAMRNAGYEIVTSPPGWDHVSLVEISDRVINDGHITHLEQSLLEQTLLLDLLTVISPEAITGSLRDRLAGAFDSLETFASEDRSDPAFLFLHVPAPHPPILVDEEGELLAVGPRSLSGNSPAAMGLTRSEYAARWRGEIGYLNRRVIQAVDRLQSANPDTVIIVMSDHGYGQEIQTTDPESRFATLFAAYTPQAPGVLADSPTPVNLMPRILNRYLGTAFPERPDRFFLSPDVVDPLILVELPSLAGSQ
jgi:hypothetical protein